MAKTFDELCKILETVQQIDDEPWVRYYNGNVSVSFNMNDIFWWATGDLEQVEVEDLPELQKAIDDVRKIDPKNYHQASTLFAARKRKMRPQSPCYKHYSPKLAELMNEAGPERNRKDEG